MKMKQFHVVYILEATLKFTSKSIHIYCGHVLRVKTFFFILTGFLTQDFDMFYCMELFMHCCSYPIPGRSFYKPVINEKNKLICQKRCRNFELLILNCNESIQGQKTLRLE